MNLKTILLSLVILALMSFSGGKNEFEFSYPKVNGTKFMLMSDKFKKFDKEWRGTDYYYYAESKDGFICSVLYYKLNKDEEKNFVEMPGLLLGVKGSSPAFPQSYFSTYSPTKKYETNEQKWGDMQDDFMFRQTDIVEFEGKKANQKNMSAYAMYGSDLFVNVHLSKLNSTPEDSVIMRAMLASLRKVK